jgi:GH24 family phage-related lysozyme (muramidase)
MEISLLKPFAPDGPVHEFDVRQMKKALNRLGYYTPYEKVGITGVPDTSIFESLKRFQKDHGLPVTGRAQPDDETVNRLNQQNETEPDGYYMWRTAEDDKVRAAHAQYNRTVRAWSDAPDPGDDFNCRCWAELVPNAAEEEYIGWQKEAFDQIKKSEQSFLFPYLDTKGIITIGTGINVDNKSAFMKLDLRIGGKDGRLATQSEKEAGYNHLKNFAKQEIAKAPKDSKNRVNKKAEFYWNKTNLFLSEKAEKSLYNLKFRQTLFNDIPKAFPKFSSLPDNAKIVIADMMFNMGATRFSREKWKNFYEAIKSRDWNRAAAESHRKDIGADRNHWARDMFMQIKERS